MQVFLLGNAKFEINDKPITFKQKRSAAILIYSLLQARPVQRWQLRELLWPDNDNNVAGKRLNDAVFGLNKDFKTAAGTEIPLIRNDNDRETLILDRQVKIKCDVRCFRQLSDRQLSDMTIADIERALALYQGEFLETFRLANVSPDFEHWIDEERSALEERYQQLLKNLGLHYLKNAQYRQAQALFERLSREHADDQSLQILLLLCASITGTMPHGIVGHSNRPSETLVRVWQVLQQHTPDHTVIKAIVAAATTGTAGDTNRQLQKIVRAFLRLTGIVKPLQPGSDYRRVLQRAEKEAAGFGFELIGTSHLFLALSIEQDACTLQFWEYLREHIGREDLIGLLSRITGEGTAAVNDPAVPLACTLELRALLQQAKEYAQQYDDDEIGLHHLWLALLNRKDSLLSRILQRYGIDCADCARHLS